MCVSLCESVPVCAKLSQAVQACANLRQQCVLINVRVSLCQSRAILCQLMPNFANYVSVSLCQPMHYVRALPWY